MRPAAPALLAAALVLTAVPLAGCDNSSSQTQASSELKDAGDKAGKGLTSLGDAAKTQAGIAADKMQPALDKAGADAKHGLDKLAGAAGKAAEKAGDSLQSAGDRAEAKAERDRAAHEAGR